MTLTSKNMPVLYSDILDREYPLPTRNVVCPDCQGEGHTSAHNIGAISADEWDDWDDESRADYLAGNYDEICPTCHGEKVVKEVFRAGVRPALLKEWDTQQRETGECDAIQRAEIAAGA